MDRRHFLELTALAALFGTLPGRAAESPETLPPWQPGFLDIHHLAYGRGNSTFILCPDGTTMLIDAGTNEDGLDVSCAQRPNSSMRPGEWIASYILRQMKPAARTELDIAILTHLHPDHIGDLGPENPPSPDGSYRLTGITDVAERVPILTLIDRGFPDYSYPAPQTMASSLNYLKYVAARRKLGQETQRIHPGSTSQIALVRRPRLYPGFRVRNLAANGEVWIGGDGDTAHSTFPELARLQTSDYPTENMCSIALLMSYGKFGYFTAGDLTSDTEESGQAWRDIETRAATAAGQVDVAVADHHGYLDAVGPNLVHALQPQAFIIPAWYVAHPAPQQLKRMLGHQPGKPLRDVFATCMMDANRAVNNQFVPAMKSTEGHVIVRVSKGGDEFRIFVTDNHDDSDHVKLMTDLYQSA